MTVFGLHTPHSLFGGADTETVPERLTQSVLESLNSVLAEPIQDVLMTDAHGRPCVETTTTMDLQRTLRMTEGNIFHGALVAGRSPTTTTRWTPRRGDGG